MGTEDALYSELQTLRERLRKEHTYSNGREPVICSDEALRDMAKLIPVKVEDFSAIVGVGQRFVEEYGEDFLAVTRKYAVSAAKGGDMPPKVAQTLRELQKKLTNISKGNRLLFQPKILKKNAYDLMDDAGDCLEMLFGRKRSTLLCDTADGKEAQSRYKHLNEIYREVNRDLRDKGQYDLYIAYPFAEGRISREEFDIRAPLALFPVTLEKTPTTMKLTLDDSRDTAFNSPLILTFIKFGGNRNRPMPSTVLEDYENEGFLNHLLKFYTEQGIEIVAESGPPERFTDYKAGEFPRYQDGSLKLFHNIVLGKYPTYSSFIQKDFDDILSKGEINGILSDLVEDLDASDFYSDAPQPLSAADIERKGMQTSEKDITYINSLNSAQENVLTAVNKEDEIVVQGPPGTGKSQVITGLIASAVTSGKTVLMVSEKKTALDVVYSRLGNLSRYCLLIDDVGNKDQFYDQLNRMMDNPNPKTGVSLTAISESIDRDVNVLTSIADKIYSPGDFGIEPYKLYGMDRWLDMGDKRQFEEYRILRDGISKKLMEIKYPQLKDLHREYGDNTLINNFQEYCDIADNHTWMPLMKPDLSDYEIGQLKADLMDLERQMIEWHQKGFVARLFSKGKVNREATAMLGRYFERFGEKTVQDVLDDPTTMVNALDSYDTFASRATVYNKLNNDEKIYGRNILSLSKTIKSPFPDTNDQIYKFVLNEHLQKFDASNRVVLQEIQDFDSIVADMDRKIGEKMRLSRDMAEQVLQENLRYVTESKRRGDIIRIIENKRKWSLNKFINRYSFELFKGVKVWLLTPEVVSEIMPLEIGLFDMLIFDEASQMYVEKGIPSIYRSKKVVVAGDHKQLRPSSLGSGRIEYGDDEDYEEDEVNAVLEEESLLDLARSRYDNILLNFHYRSKYEELIAFSNYAFYGGRLFVSPNVLDPEKPPIEVHRVDGRWENKSNKAEAAKILELLKGFFINRRENESIGIVTFNVSQRDLIYDYIDEESAKDPAFGKMVTEEMNRFDDGEDRGLFIKNIESVQGDERDVIMFSVGYAKNSDGKLMQRFGWLNNRGGENRLNVAISRAKKKIHIVTSFEPEELQVEVAKNEGPRILKKYLQYARAVSDRNSELATVILNSFGDTRWTSTQLVSGDSSIIERVSNALVRKGYTVEKDVGIGGYRIDMAVKQGGRYILGIECDSHIYETTASTRERDYHRQKYLESRGWHIHRVWTPGMWKNPDGEIAKIVKAIEKVQDSC